MSEQMPDRLGAEHPDQPPATTPQASAATPAAADKPPRRRRRRRWPWVIVGIIVLLLILAALAPTIASSGLARSAVLGIINRHLNGHAEIKDWSLSWTGGMHVDGLVIFDESNRQVLQLPHLSTGLTLWHALRGHYDLGRTEVDGLDALVSREPDGSLNWNRILKSSPDEHHESSPAHEGPPPSSTPASKLPDVHGELVLNQCNLTYEDRAANQAAYVRQVQADLKIPDINEPIANTLTAQVQIGSGQQGSAGTVAMAGTVAAVHGNVVDAAHASVNETLDLAGIDLGVLPTFMATKAKPRLSGQSNGHFVIAMANGNAGSVQANVALMGVNLSAGDGAAARPVLQKYDSTFVLAATYTRSGETTDLNVGQLNITDNQRVFGLAKAGDRPFAIVVPATASRASGGAIDVFCDLKRLNDILHALQEPAVAVTDEGQNELTSGILAGQVALAQAGPDGVKLTGNLSVDHLSLGAGDGSATAAAPIQNETVKITLDATANQNLSVLEVAKLDASGSLLSAQVSDTRLKLSNGPNAPRLAMLDMLQRVKARVDVPSLTKVQRVMRAFSKPHPEPHIAGRPAPGPAIALAGRGAPAEAVPPSARATTGPAPVSPPADITSGSATLTLNADRDAQALHLTPVLSFTKLAFRRGAMSYDAGDVNLNAAADLSPAPANASPSGGSILEQIAELRVGTLHLSAPSVGGADVSLVEPIDVKDPGGLAQLFAPGAAGGSHATAQASASGRILVRGDPGPLMALKDALAGQASEHHFGGGYAIDEQLATDASGVITARGRMDLNDLVVDGQPYIEKAFRILSDVALNGRAKVLDLRNLTLSATQTNALSMVVKGRITDLGGRQAIDNVLTADLTYDAAQAWKMVEPLLDKSLQQRLGNSQAAGKYQKQFRISGAYPSGDPQAIRQLRADGDLTIDLFSGAGVQLSHLALPVSLSDGVARVALAGKPEGQNMPAPAGFNGGTLDLAGCQVDLTGQDLRISMPPNLPLVHHATLNPVFAAWSLGEYLNNPMFVNASTATGVLDVTIIQCDRLPLDSSLSGAGDPGRAKFNISIDGLNVGNPTLEKVADALRLNLRSFRGSVKTYQLAIDHGITTHDLAMTVGEGERPLRMFGQVRMSNRQMLPVTLDLPWKLFALKGVDDNVRKFLPEGIQIPLTGTVDSPRLAIDANQIFGQAAQNAMKQGVLQGLIPGNKEGGGTTRPARDNPLNQIEGVLNGIGGGKK